VEFSSVPFEGKRPFQYVSTDYNLPDVSAALCPQKNGIWANWRHGVDVRLADLDAIDGQRNRLEDRLTKRYGFAEDHVRKEIDDWLRWQTQTLQSPGANRTKLGPPLLRRNEI
jgi:hypothetical protein